MEINRGGEQTRLVMDDGEFATGMARRICTIYVPEWMRTFIEKNRKYRKVDNHLGARGVYPDINRKVGILEARVWDGDEPTDGAESTVEVIDDLIGHLFLMRDMLLQEGASQKRLPGMEPHEHKLDGLGNCVVEGCSYAHVGPPLHTGDLLPDALDVNDDDAEDDGDLMPENQHDRADRLSREAHGWTR